MSKVIGHVKKSYYIYALLAVLVVAGIVAGGYIKNIHADDQAYVVADEVVINGKTYTADNKMQVLMIAPDEAYDEIGVLIGDDKGSIRFEDIMKLAPSSVAGNDMDTLGTADYTFKRVLSGYQDFLNGGIINNTKYRIVYKLPGGTYNQFSSFWDSTHLNGSWNNLKLAIQEKTSDGNWKDVPYRNVFAAIIFNNYNMDNKMDYTIKKASDVGMSDIENADLIYISAKSHNTAAIPTYNMLTGRNAAAGVTYAKGTNDLDANEALYLMECYAKGEKRVILDTMTRDYGNGESNIRKIGFLFTAIDPDVYITDFVRIKGAEGFYSYGDKGSIKIVDNSIKLYYKKDTGKEINFQADMFINGGNNFAVQENDKNENAARHDDYEAGYPVNSKDKYPYYNATASGKGTFVNPYLYVFNGNNSMTSGMTNDIINISDYTTDYAGNKTYNGSTYQAALDATGVIDSNGNKVLHPSDAIEYILGVYNNSHISSIKVLEIEPAGFSRYDNNNGKKAIASWFGLSGEQYDRMAADITVDCYSMNAFIGLNKDIRSDYDLVIVGAYDYDKFNTDIYKTPYDTDMKLNNYKLTGNDITQKAYEQLYSYVAAGMPLVLDDGIYYNLDSVVDSGCDNLKKLQAVSLKKRLAEDNIPYVGTNIAHVNTRGTDSYKMISKSLYYVNKPSVDIRPAINGIRISDYSEKKNGDGTLSSAGTVSNESLSDIHFNGSLSGNGSYRVKIYVDRNNDSIFSENYSGEKNELIYYDKNGGEAVTDANGNILGVPVSGDSFDIAIPLPTTLRGYIKWKVEVTDAATSAVKNSEGAFAISTGASAKTIKVLQVENDSETAHINLKGKAFTNTFERTIPVTGLSVDIVKVKKSELNTEIVANPEYLNNFSMIVLGFSDNYGNDLSDALKNFSDEVNDALYNYVEAGNSILFTHDCMSYKNGSSSLAASDESQINSFTRKFKDRIGMKSGFSLTDVLKLKLDSYKVKVNKKEVTKYYSIYNDVTASGNTRITDKVKQLNSGQITEYPYTLSGQAVMSVSDTHAQYYQLDLEAKQDSEDVVVWYTLAGNGSDAARYFEYTGQDAVNNYYAYSIGNITYTSAGHSMIDSEGDEMELFVNTFVRALLAGNNIPQVEYENAEKIDDNNYAIYYRQRPSTDSLTIEYVVTDADVIANSGQVKEAYIYYDKDGDGAYSNDDIRIGYLDKNGNVSVDKPADGGVYCGRQYSLALWNPGGVCSSAITKDVLSEMKDKMANGTLMLGISAVDGSKAIGYASLQIAYRPLFNLN